MSSVTFAVSASATEGVVSHAKATCELSVRGHDATIDNISIDTYAGGCV